MAFSLYVGWLGNIAFYFTAPLCLENTTSNRANVQAECGAVVKLKTPASAKPI
jgi:hypothetical protein